MEALFSELSEISQAILRTETNFKKIGKANQTVATVKSRLELLDQRWKKCETLHLEIKAGTTSTEREQLEYFSKSKYLAIEDAYLNARDFLYNQLTLLTPEPRANESLNQSQIIRHDSLSVKLPQITLPEFSGDYKDWENFRDLFNALIIQNESLSNVTRLHYLKLSLKGEAAGLLKHVSITDANFISTWESLKTRFDNKRALISTHLQSFINLPNVSNNILEDLKNLRDKTNESLAALKNLKRLTEHWSDLLVFMMVKKFDISTLKEWEMHIGSSTDYPTYQELDSFLETRIRILEAIKASKAGTSSQEKSRASKQSGVRSHNATSSSKCLLCKENHSLFKCNQFKALSVDRRREVATNNHCCYNCLTPGHRPHNCASKFKCNKCGRRHNSLLHSDDYNSNPTLLPPNSASVTSQLAVTGSLASQSNDPGNSTLGVGVNHVSLKEAVDDEVSFHFLNNHPNLSRSTLLATAVISFQAENGKGHRFRVLLDQGSECCFISERAMKILSPRYKKVKAVVYGVGGVNIGSSRKLAEFNLIPTEKNCPKVHIQALVLLHLTSYTPPVKSTVGNEDQIKELGLADPNPFSSHQVDLILGADKYGSCLLPGLQQGILGSLTAQSTVFGWILSGPVSPTNQIEINIPVTAHQAITAEVLHEDLTKFWELEEVPFKNSLTDDEMFCDEHFATNYQRTEDGRYMIRLPFRNGPPIKIGASLERAKIVLNKVLRRLSDKSGLFSQYSSFLSEYESLGHMELLEEKELDSSSQTVYLPHHPILKESSSTTKLRVVFNASSLTSNNSSLNSHLHIGPKILNDLVSIIMNWRSHRFVYMADIEKMFRQILIDPRDCDYQRIVWISPDKGIVAYRLLTVTYGTACAPYLANKVIKQLAHDEGNRLPLAQTILENNIYVDDVLFGADSQIEAKKARAQVTLLLEAGGFHLRKWAANDPELLEDCPSGKHERAIEFPLAEDAQLKVLGLFWDPDSDSFLFKVTSSLIEHPTKRIVLSLIAKLYDPLGWITPVIIVAKILMQELWLRKLDWDDKLPDDLKIQWLNYHDSLEKLEALKVPRWTRQLQTNSEFELHGFSDASSKAYSASVYIRILSEDLKEAHVCLLMAKSKVAPVKYVSIPRLELCGAALLTKTLKFVIETMSLDKIPVYCHTDSVTVLAWLGKHPSNWPVFVANRVSLIHELVPRAKWRYISTKDNPADCATRGLTPEKLLRHSSWWQGPPWLALHSSKWPDYRHAAPLQSNLEQRALKSHHGLSEIKSPFDLMFKFSSWPKLLRVTAYCKRFIDAFVFKHAKFTKPKPQFSNISLNAIEIQQAVTFWIKFVQANSFSVEIKALNQEDRMIPKNSILKSLNPFLDSNDLLRLGGRLRHAPISFDEKHPIILPRHHISELIATHAHLRSLHGGQQLTLHTLRQRYWVLGARSLVKRLIKGCLECTRERAALSQQLMGDLPVFRVTPNRPFTHSGVDYAGPFNVRFAPGRGRKSYKTYVALFVCCCTRAVHLELVSDYSSAAFLAAFQRFSSRRGRPAHLYSDNGTTFHGADRELKNCLLNLRLDTNLHNEFAIQGTSWHFIPPSAPHFGGLWEAGVKSFKHHMKRVVGAHTLTYEEFYTLLTRIEACLNSRPIAPLSNDPEDFSYLTPGHFLIGAPLTSVPEPSLEFTSENRVSRWQLVQKISEIYWRRWAVDYLQSLQKRYKWFNKELNLVIGDIVLVKHDSLPPSRWLLGRIIKCYKGKDDVVRSVRVKTASSEYERPITQICLLPVRAKEISEI